MLKKNLLLLFLLTLPLVLLKKCCARGVIAPQMPPASPLNLGRSPRSKAPQSSAPIFDASIADAVISQETPLPLTTPPSTRRSAQSAPQQMLSDLHSAHESLLELRKSDEKTALIAGLILCYGFPHYFINDEATPLHLALATHNPDANEAAFYGLTAIEYFLIGAVFNKDQALNKASLMMLAMIKELPHDSQDKIKKIIEKILIFCLTTKKELATRYGPLERNPDGSRRENFVIERRNHELEVLKKALNANQEAQNALTHATNQAVQNAPKKQYEFPWSKRLQGLTVQQEAQRIKAQTLRATQKTFVQKYKEILANR